MAASVSSNFGRSIINPGTGIAFEIEISECAVSTSPIPKRVRQRLQDTVDCKSKTPASLEDIEIKLKEADLRRQQFHEWLANKARSKQRCGSSLPPQAEDLAQRLEAKLSAAEQKRAELLAQEQTRLAKQHELRVAAKTEAQLRAEREREELGTKVESRVQQAETNRLALLEAEKQRRATVHERMAQFLMQRMTQEGRDRDRIEALRTAICQKIAAAEEKRAGLLEAEKSRAQACVMQARRVAKAVLKERELESRKKKEKLEARLQRAKRQRAEYLRQRGGCRGSCHNHGHKLHKHGDRLCRKLTRCWRQFRRSRRTTYALAQEYAACAINQEFVTSLPFEQLAARITATTTLRSVKSLLARIESRLVLSSAGQYNIARVDHLLKRLFPVHRKAGIASASSGGKKFSSGSSKGCTKDGARSQVSLGVSKVGKEGLKVDDKETERYPARVFLCAYMILGQPDAVFSGRGEREVALADAAAKLLPEFEALLAIILDGPASSPPRPSSPSYALENKSEWASEVQDSQSLFSLPSPQRPFAAQLASFDTAWCSYLYQFVAWKVKDAQLLEEDLTRMACQLELSMLQKCKSSYCEDGSDLSHDSQAIRKQVLEDQNLLRDRVLHLTGNAGASRMEEALLNVRSKFNEAVENGTPLPLPFPSTPLRTPPNSSISPSPFLGSSQLEFDREISTKELKPKNAKSVSTAPSPLIVLPGRSDKNDTDGGSQFFNIPTSQCRESAFSNEKILNEMLHDSSWKFSEQKGCSGATTDINHKPVHVPSKLTEMQAQVRTTMENAFWDGIVEGLLKSPPDYSRVVNLVGEIREEIEIIVPASWREDLHESMDLELLSQTLESGSHDFEYLRRLLDYSSGLILKLGAPVRDTETKAAHQSLISTLASASRSSIDAPRVFADALVKGIRFTFEQLQVLKQDISSSRLRALTPLISGSAGIEYMRNAFSTRFDMPPGRPVSFSELTGKLPLTVAWITEGLRTLDQEGNDVETALGLIRSRPSTGLETGLVPPISSMRTGGRLAVKGGYSTTILPAAFPAGDTRRRVVVWRGNDTLVRLCLLHIMRNPVAATAANVPETCILNVERLRSCQNEFQRIIVIATGMLVARQGLTGRGVVGTELDKLIEVGLHQLDLLLSNPAVTVAQIGALLAQISTDNRAAEKLDLAEYTDLMTSVLAKSLSHEDPVFARVLAAVGASFRAVLLLGKGAEGVSLAEMALRRIGGTALLDKVVNAAETLESIASITCRIHEPWYSAIVTNLQ